MRKHGYYRWPTAAAGRIVFVCEDDLWTVPVAGGVARRLTSGLGHASRPHLSPDGSLVAFTADDEGPPEVYVMDADGGAPRRLTWLGDMAYVVGWTPDGDIVFTTMANSPFFRDWRLHAIPPEGGEPKRLPWGQGSGIAFGPDGRVAIGWYMEDIAWWKRYRGGRAAVIHVDGAGDGHFRRLLDFETQACAPMWIGDRVWFVSDHERVGNLYSVLPDGSDVQRHTDHADHYVRWPSTDGERVVYVHAGGLRSLDLATGESTTVEVELRSPGTQLRRRFVDPVKYLEGVDLHPDGRALALTVRGKPVVLGNWEGATLQLGAVRDGSVRYREARWVDAERILLLSDETGDERFELHAADGGGLLRAFDGLDIGRPVEIAVDPTGSRVALTDHTYRMHVLELEDGSIRLVDRSRVDRCSGLAWSPCGGWLAWSHAVSDEGSRAKLRLLRVADGTVTELTDGRYGDRAPAWDPEGRYLYFLSRREFDPVYDAVYFDLGFTWSERPYVFTLRADLPSPFQPVPHPLVRDEPPRENAGPTAAVEIDLPGISDRLVAFPVEQGRYHKVVGVRGMALMSIDPVEGQKNFNWHAAGEPSAGRTLHAFDFERQASAKLRGGITDFMVDRSGRTLLVRVGNRFQVKPVPRKVPDKPPPVATGPDATRPGRKSGWVDLARASVAVEPRAEWGQMFRETWRLMRDHFWNEQMSGVDWDAMWERYSPLLDRVGSRAEYSDLVWCMVGETGTSHCYEMLGDYRDHPRWTVGRLGAELSWDRDAGGYRVDRIVRGEPADEGRCSPLIAPGVGVVEGDVIKAIGGVPVAMDQPVGQLLADRAGREVALTVNSRSGSRTVVVRTLKEAMPVWYRDWVLTNQRWVHDASDGEVGYVHIPDMGPAGFSAFHRDYLGEVERKALLVDVRYNRGGHVSQLLIEKLARRIVGWNLNRWGVPHSYPSHAPRGPMVALTNGFAGSDGDIFSHVWKLNGLGPLLGERTWGGVVGIWPRFRHVDGSLTTQPEFAFWFEDVGFGVENHGTDPDEVVAMGPEHFATGRDPQLEAGIERVLAMLEAQGGGPPDDFGPRPHLGE